MTTDEEQQQANLVTNWPWLALSSVIAEEFRKLRNLSPFLSPKGCKTLMYGASN
jgi:hypothetical protein